MECPIVVVCTISGIEMDKSDLTKAGIYATAVAISVNIDVDVDLVELLKFVDDGAFVWPIMSDGHQTFASATGSTVIEVPTAQLSLTTSAPEVSISASSTATG